MGRKFTLSGENLTLGTGNVLAAIRTAADALTAGGILKLLRVRIWQNGTETSDMIRAEIFTRNTSGTLTMTSATPRNKVLTGPASGISGSTAPAGTAARCGINSSADSGGTYASEHPLNFNNLNGEEYIPVAGDEPIIGPGLVFGIRLLASPTSTTGWGFTLEFEEVV